MEKRQFLDIAILSAVLAFVLLFIVTFAAIFNTVKKELDENFRVEFVSKKHNEDNGLWAIKYITSRGATTGFTQNLMINKNGKTPDDVGNVLRTPNEFDYYWRDEDTMVVIIYGNRPNYHQETEYKGIEIVYE